MTNTSHHLDEATIMRYAAGDLDEAFTVIVAAHVAMCDQCRKAVRDAEEFGGGLLETAEVESVNDDAFASLMAAIDAEPQQAANIHPFPKRGRVSGDVPLPLQRLVGDELDHIKWKKVAPGISKHDIDLGQESPSSLFMLHIAEGHAVPEHDHGGMEMTLVLSGSYTDRFGTFGAGDIADLDEHMEHQPIVDAGGPCICIVATEKPTKFKGLVERMLQPIIGI